MQPRAVLLSLAAAAALAGVAAAQDLPDIQARGTLRVLAVTSAEQTFFVSDAPRGGFDWEMLEGFGKLHKVTLELAALESGRVTAGVDGIQAALDEHIANARRTPTWNRLAVKYFGPAAPEILRNSARK
jgi:hypothetical protein